MQSSTTLRYGDVLMAVFVAEKYSYYLTRIQLQKFVYFADTLSTLWNILKHTKGHETYKHGPYDQDIQNAVDTLAFRGFIKITEFEILENGKVYCKYGLTNQGKELIDRLTEHPSFQNKFKMYHIIGREINSRDWSKLVEFVYVEPTYLSERQNGWGRPLILDNMITNLSMQMISMIENVASVFENRLPPKTLVSLYFDMLSGIIEKNDSIKGDEYEYVPIT